MLGRIFNKMLLLGQWIINIMAFKKEYISQTDNVPVFHGNVSTNTEGTLFGYPGLTVCSFYHLDSVGTQMVKGAKVTKRWERPPRDNPATP